MYLELLEEITSINKVKSQCFYRSKIKKKKKIEVSDEETDKRASELAEKYKMKKDEFVEAFGGIEFIKYDLEMNKVIDLLKEENK